MLTKLERDMSLHVHTREVQSLSEVSARTGSMDKTFLV
jgi:hypothetical protein